jgi:O-antigen/teichoic acid export membrane protein
VNRLRKTLLANYAGQLCSAIMNIAFIPLYIQYLGAESYGLIGTFSIVLTCALVLDAGLSPMLNREMARYRASADGNAAVVDLLRSIEIVFLIIIVLLTLLGFSSSSFIARLWFHNNSLPFEQVHHALFLMIVVALLRVGEGIYRGALLGLGHHARANCLLAGLATLRSGGAALVIMFIEPSIEAFFLWQASVSALGVFLAAVSVHANFRERLKSVRFSRTALREVQQFTSAILATTLLALLLTQTDKILLVRLFPLNEFAYYALASTVAGALYQLVGPIAQSYYPRFTMLIENNDQDQLVKTYHQGAQLLSVAIMPVTATLIACSKEILTLWVGKSIDISPVLVLLPILTLGTMLHGMMYLPYMLQLASGWSSLSAKVNLVAVCFIVPAVFLLVKIYGPPGAAVAWLLLNVGYVFVSIHFMHRRLLPTEKWRWYMNDVGAPLAATATMALLLIALRPSLSGNFQCAMWVAFFSLCVLGAAVLSTQTTRMMSVLIGRNIKRGRLIFESGKQD